jgi:myo-inositol-1(or 4)-monophosphatase
VSSYVAVAAEIAREAGALLTRFFERRVPYELKGEHDLVTEADRASEQLIVEHLKSHFPSHGILAEEGGGHTSPSEYVWYVDPLDGTTNFAHGFPIYNVTLALERSGQMIAGVVYDPTRDEMFTAELGGGAFLNNRRIHVSKTARVNDALVATGFPSLKRHENINVHFYYQLALISHGVRRAGAAAIDLAYVACGRLDAFWEFGLKPWDMAAGSLLVEEAGGLISDMKGLPAGVRSPHLLTDNGLIHSGLLDIFAEIFSNQMRYPMVEISTVVNP